MPKIVDHDQRRREIASAVLKVVAREGIRGVTMRSVAAEAGWSTGVLTHFFADKQELLAGGLREAARTAGQNMTRAMAERAGLQRLRAVVEEGMPLDERREALCRIFFFFWAEGVGDAALGAELGAYYDWWRNLIREAIERCQEEGSIPPFDSMVLAEMLVALADGVAVQAMFSRKPITKQRQRDHIGRWLDIVASRPARLTDAKGAEEGGMSGAATAYEIPAMDPSLADAIAPRRDAYRAAGHWSPVRFADRIAFYAATRPDAEAVVDQGGARRVTFRLLDSLANRAGAFLIDAGVEEGDVVALQMPNCLEAVVAAIAVNRIGAVGNPMLTVYRAKELRYMLSRTRAKAIFAPDTYRNFSHRDLIASVAAELDHPIRPVLIEGAGETTSTSWIDSLMRWSDSPCGRAPKASAVSVILFTSGTEAAPKAVMHTEETLNSNLQSVWRSFAMGDDEVVWMPSPVGHSTGFNYGIRYGLFHGAKLVLQDRWNPEEALALVQREKPTYTLTATVFLTDLLRAAAAQGVKLPPIRIFGCGGAPIPPQVVTDAAAHGINVLRLYGQTETVIATLNPPSSPFDKRVQCDGMAIDGMTVDVRDDAGRPLPRGTEGELWVTGPGLCVGYYKDRERTAAKFQDGWVRTGDLAVMDGDGYITIIGRKSDIIIRGGQNIAPREIEEEIAKMDGVKTVVVVGLPDDRLGEICCACVVPTGSATVTLDQITGRLRAIGMATFKLPQALAIVPELPTTASGKIQRHVLVAELKSKPRDSLR